MAATGYVERMRRLAGQHGIEWVGDFLRVGDEYVHYMAEGSGPAVLLLHGLFAWSYTWRLNLAPLAAAAGAWVYAPDLRGFGLTTRTRGGYQLWDQARLMLRFMDELGIPRAVVVGHSMGGEVALRMALTAPERVSGLVLVCSSCFIRADLPRSLRLALKVPGVGALAARLFWMNERFAWSLVREGYGDPDRIGPEMVRNYLFPARAPGAVSGLVRLAVEQDFGQCATRVGEIRQPSLLVWGGRDPWTALPQGERLARALPDAAMHLFPAAGHLPHEEFPEQFNQLVGAWLRGRLHPEN